jgi:hypothetical protein
VFAEESRALCGLCVGKWHGAAGCIELSRKSRKACSPPGDRKSNVGVALVWAGSSSRLHSSGHSLVDVNVRMSTLVHLLKELVAVGSVSGR